MDLWQALEKQTESWHALDRQAVADAIWEDYVSFRFGQTGDPRALQFLYPYLNHADRRTRLRAIEAACGIFRGRGVRSLEALTYFTQNRDPFIRDRAVCVVAAALAGTPADTVLEALEPYLNHPNQFIRKLALVQLGSATEGQASEAVCAEIERVGRTPGPRPDEVAMSIATAFSGRPTEDVYARVVHPRAEDALGRQRDACAAGILVRGAGRTWYDRAFADIFESQLKAQHPLRWNQQLIRRAAIEGLSLAGTGMGMAPLSSMLHTGDNRCNCNDLLRVAPRCFRGTPREANRGPLLELLRSGQTHEQRIAAAALGRLMLGTEDDECIAELVRLCEAPNRAVRSSALAALGMAAKSSCDEALRKRCMACTLEEETAKEAIRALGLVFHGSGREDAFGDLRALTKAYRARPVVGRKHCKPLSTCYTAVGFVFAGTGSMAPVQYFLDALANPHSEYAYRAARALVTVEYPEAALGWPLYR